MVPEQETSCTGERDWLLGRDVMHWEAFPTKNIKREETVLE
jgi:hypothetical protein